MPLSNSNTYHIQETNLIDVENLDNVENIDPTESLKWSLIKKSEFGDELTNLESSISSGMSSSGGNSATLEIQNIVNDILPISKSQSSNSNHLTTPIIDLWSREVQLEPISLFTKPKK